MSDEKQTKPIKKSRSLWRWLMLFLGALCVLVLLGFIGVFIAFKTGYVDSYIKNALIERFIDFGIKAEIENVKTTISPTTAELTNLQFFDEQTGEKLAKIDKLKIDLTLVNIWGLRSAREININSTDVEGLEVWVKFDEKGNSNFSNLKFKVEEDSNLKVSLASMNFNLKDAIVHYGDEMRKISGTAKSIKILVEPENPETAEKERRYKFDLSSEKSIFVYNEKPIEPIDVYAKGIADKNGAEISSLRIKTPIGESFLSGTVTDWKLPKYDLKITSTIDLQQTATLLPSGTALRGFGNFEGTVTGEGEKYSINGEVTSESLAASNIILKGLQVNTKIDGENSIYEGNGKAIAEMLTFEDFRIDFPQLIGKVRGNGTDFKWFGELQAASAKSPNGTLASLFISDAVAEYKDKQFSADFGTLRAGKFTSEDLIAENIRTQNLKFSTVNGVTNINAPNVQANVVKAEGVEIGGVNANGVKVVNNGGKTSAEINNLQAKNLRTADAQLNNVKANGVNVTSQNGSTDVQAKNVEADGLNAENTKVNGLKAGEVDVKIRGNQTDIQARNVQSTGVDADGAKVGAAQASNVNVTIRGNQTDVYSDTLKVARVETDAAILGSLNIAGVRLKIIQGRIEGTSGDIDAGNVDLKSNGKLENAKLYKPIFVLEPSGRYRASMDMSLGGGTLGSVKLGAAKASVIADNDKVTLNNLSAAVMDGTVNGNAVIAMNQRNSSKVDADFSGLDLGKLIALQGGKVMPITGETTGKVNLTFFGTDFKSASGTLVADFKANAGTAERGLVPVNGNLGLKAINGLFDVDYANLNTEKSKLNATGKFDLRGNNSNLTLALDSSDATEIERLLKVFNVSPELEQQLADNQITFAGNLKFNGTLTGNFDNPNIDGQAMLDSIAMRGRELGMLSTKILVSQNLVELQNGNLRERNGGFTEFNISIPQTGKNNISVQAKLTRVNTGNLLAALPLEKYLPAKFRDFNAETSGTINLQGLPNEMIGLAELKSGAGSVAGQPFESFAARLNFKGTVATLEDFDARFADGYLKAKGTYQRDTSLFDLDIEGKNLQASRLRPLVTDDKDFPAFAGTIDLTAKATGKGDQFSTFNIAFQGSGQNITINDNAVGTINFVGTTVNQLLKTELTANLEGQSQVAIASINFADERLPFRAETNFNQTELAPFVALFRPADSVAINGKATGNISFGGNLYDVAKKEFTDADLRGTAQFSEFGLQFDETPITATQPITINFNTREVVVENARFAGAGSNLVVSGTKALNDNGFNNLAVDGKINMRLLNLASKNTFFSGLADVSIRLTGVNTDSRLSGSANVDNASISTFVGSERLNFERIKGRVIFTSNQAQIDQAVGYLGGGKVVGTGGASVEGLKLQRFRLELRGQNITAPLPKNFLTTGDANVEITSKCDEDEITKKCVSGGSYNTLIAGTIFAKRSIYSKDIDLADVISSRRDATISEGTTAPLLGIPRLDLRLQGRDALVVRNNLADLTASVDLRVTGDVDYPVISGRITANSGTVFFRSDRYEVRRGTLEFPPQTDNEPVINLQAETDIKGYQVFVNLAGELSNLDALTATVRSNPALPQADVISLVTTGNLANTESGISTTGINTAAEVITDSLINNPIRKATDKLFGLNKFEIDPILSGKRLNPTARLTVGRQINKNLLVTYSTNLSEDQNQVLALEYRVSNRLSFVAQYEQGSLSNVTRNNNNFGFEIRLRKRF